MIIINVNILHLGVLFQQQSGVSQVGFRRVAYNSPEIVGIARKKVASHFALEFLCIIFCARWAQHRAHLRPESVAVSCIQVSCHPSSDAPLPPPVINTHVIKNLSSARPSPPSSRLYVRPVPSSSAPKPRRWLSNTFSFMHWQMIFLLLFWTVLWSMDFKDWHTCSVVITLNC